MNCPSRELYSSRALAGIDTISTSLERRSCVMYHAQARFAYADQISTILRVWSA